MHDSSIILKILKSQKTKKDRTDLSQKIMNATWFDL